MTYERTRAWRERHPEKYRAQNRRTSANHRQNHPEKVRARRAVASAVERGDLVREPCHWCGGEKVEAHHYLSYEPEFWLDVLWLCREHHLEAHRGPDLIDGFLAIRDRLRELTAAS
jgi:hypothetical protein